MRYTAIALDYDGTIAQDGVVPSHVLEGLRLVKASGRKLLLVTGRQLEELLGIFPGIAIFDRVVAENGAVLYRTDNGERHELGEPPPGRLVEALKATGIPLAVGHTILATVRPYETLVLECIANLGLEQQVIFNKGAVMVLPPGCNKASGLKLALAELALSPRNLVAVGDGENDHALLELAEYSFATRNAVPTLQEAADAVTGATHGDGVLEVIGALLDSDLTRSTPHRRRRITLGKDTRGADVVLPTSSSSLLLVGDSSVTSRIANPILEQLGKAGYQFCVLDMHGTYAGASSAISFGTLTNAPAIEEINTALQKPDIQTVVCAAALPVEERQRFARKLLALLCAMRSRTGRPHWILVDAAYALMPRTAQPMDGCDGSTIFVTDVPQAIAAGIPQAIDAVVASGKQTDHIVETLGMTAQWGKPVLLCATGDEPQARAWFRSRQVPVAPLDTGHERG